MVTKPNVAEKRRWGRQKGALNRFSVEAKELARVRGKKFLHKKTIEELKIAERELLEAKRKGHKLAKDYMEMIMVESYRVAQKYRYVNEALYYKYSSLCLDAGKFLAP